MTIPYYAFTPRALGPSYRTDQTKSQKCGKGRISLSKECQIGKVKPSGEKAANVIKGVGRAAKGVTKTEIAAGAGASAAGMGILPGAYAGAAASTGVGVMAGKLAVVAAQVLPASQTASIASALGVGSPHIASMAVSAFGATSQVAPMLGSVAAGQIGGQVALAAAPYLIPGGAVIGLAAGGYLGYKMTKKLLNDIDKGISGNQARTAKALVQATGTSDLGEVRKHTRDLAASDPESFAQHREAIDAAMTQRPTRRIRATIGVGRGASLYGRRFGYGSMRDRRMLGRRAGLNVGLEFGGGAKKKKSRQDAKPSLFDERRVAMVDAIAALMVAFEASGGKDNPKGGNLKAPVEPIQQQGQGVNPTRSQAQPSAKPGSSSANNNIGIRRGGKL